MSNEEDIEDLREKKLQELQDRAEADLREIVEEAAAADAPAGDIAAAAPAGAQERVRWRVPIAFPSSLPALGDNLQFVAEQLEMASGGNIDWRIAEPGEPIRLDLEAWEALGPGGVVPISRYSPRVMEIIDAGGMIALMKRRWHGEEGRAQ